MPTTLVEISKFSESANNAHNQSSDNHAHNNPSIKQCCGVCFFFFVVFHVKMLFINRLSHFLKFSFKL
ncbi:hypothetical protein X975_24689, partial [Stegodyphus mimosarum]